MRWLMVLVLSGCGEAAVESAWDCDGEQGNVDAAFSDCLVRMAVLTEDVESASATMLGDYCLEYARGLFCKIKVDAPEPVTVEPPDEALAIELVECEVKLEAVEEMRLNLMRCPGWDAFRTDCRAWETSVEVLCEPGSTMELCGPREHENYDDIKRLGSLDEAWEATR